MRNNRKNKNKQKITERNFYRIKQSIRAKAYERIDKDLTDDVVYIENRFKLLNNNAYSSAKERLNKIGFKPYYLQEVKVENRLGNNYDDLIQNKLILLTEVVYRIKFIK